LSSPHPAPTSTYTLSLHDALPILLAGFRLQLHILAERLRSQLGDPLGALADSIRDLIEGRDFRRRLRHGQVAEFSELYVRFDEVDRKSTRLNSSHVKISYAVFCLK